MNKDTKLSIIVTSALVAATVAIGLLFWPEEPTRLHYINFALLLVMEILYGGMFGIAWRGNHTIPFWIAVWTSVGGYIALFISTMLLSAVISEKLYFTLLILLTMFTVIALAFLWRVDSSYAESVQQLKTEQDDIVDIHAEMDVLRKKYVRLCAEKGIVYKTESNNTSAMDALCQKLQHLTPNVVRHPRAQRKFGAILDEARQLISQMQNASPEGLEMANKAILNFVQDSVEEIDMLKTTCRS